MRSFLRTSRLLGMLGHVGNKVNVAAEATELDLKIVWQIYEPGSQEALECMHLLSRNASFVQLKTD